MHDTFKVGDRVTMTPEGLKQGLQGRKNRTEGVVKGVCPYPGTDLISVLRDGMKHVVMYYGGFWAKKEEIKK